MSRHNEFDRRGSVLATERHHAFLGAAKVKLQHIDIGPKGRLDMAKVMRLRRVFRVNGIYPLQRENHVEVVISQSDLEQTLGQHGLTLQEFRGKDPGSYPTLDFTGRPLKCLHGKHRIQAARDVLPSFRRWWIVDFYIEGLSNELRNIQSETYAHENPKTKGEIYLKIRHYQRINDPLSARRWEARLSAHEELIHYMRRGIWDFWATTVAQNENTKMNLIDANSVKLLEGLAPGISEADRTTVTGLVLSGKALEDFSPDERKAICERMRSYKGRIPSLSLFFQDVLILELGAARVKRLVDRSKRWGPRDIEMGDYQERKQTLRERMEHMFRCRDTDSIMVQTSDGEEREVTGDGEFLFDLAYRQLWLCALRSCSGSPGEGHRPATVCRSWTHPHEQYKLAQLARALGFRSNSISRLASRPFEPEYPPWYEFDDRGRNPALKRCGIPYTITFREDRETLFLDRIHQEASEYEELDSAFVLRDIYLSFFGDLPSSVLEGPQRPRRARDGQSPEAGPLPTSGAENRPSSGAAPSSTTMPSSTTTRRPTSQRETGHPATPATPATPAADMNPQVNSGREQSAPSPSMHSEDIEELSTRPTMPSETTGATTMPPTEPPVAPGETRDWSPELMALMNDLRKLRDDIDNLSIRLDNPKFTDQQSAIIELRKLDTATVESTDEETRQKLGTIYAEVNKRCMDIQSARSHIHVAKVEVGSEISKLTAFTQNGEGKSQETTQVAQALRSAQAVFDSSQGKYEELDRFLRDVTPRIRPLQQQIAGIKVYLLGKCLIDLHHQYENCSSDVDIIRQSVADLNTKLDPQRPASHETDVTILNDIKDNAITKVNVIWRELDAVRGAFQEAGGKPRSLNPLECESLQQNSATKLETLKAETEKALTISKKQIQDVKQRLQTGYARIVLLAKEAVKSELDSESTKLKKLISDYEGVHSPVERIRKTLKDNKDSLEQNIEHSMLQGLRDLIDNDNLDGISQSLQTMQETHDINVGQLDNSAIFLEVPLDTQAKIYGKYMDIRTGITNREKEREILLERIKSQQKSTQEYYVQMDKALQSAVSSQSEKVQLKASETTTQLQVVRDAESLTTAKQAMESAKQAANESMRLAKGMVALAGLVNQDGPLDLRKHCEKGANRARTAAQEAESAAKAGQLFVNVWEEVVQKMESFLQRANNWKELSTKYSEPVLCQWIPTQSHDVAKEALKRVSNLAHKTCGLRKQMGSEIPSMLDRAGDSDQARLAEIVNLRVPKFEEATLETLTAAFGLFYWVTQRTADHTKSKMTEIENFSTSAIEAIKKNDRDEWLIVDRDARKAKEYLDKAVELAERGMNEADRLKKATVDQEGSKGAIPELALQHVTKTGECLQFAKDNQTEALQMLQDIQISWSRALASEKKETAQAEYDRAREAVDRIQPNHSLSDAEIVRNAFKTMEDLFKVTQQDFEKCCGPNERFEEIADQFASVTNRAKSVIKGAEAVLRKRTLTSEQHPVGDPSTLQDKSGGKRSRVGEPPRRMTRTQRKHQYVFIIKTIGGKPTAKWERELHSTEAGRVLQKGRELCARGTLCALNGDLTKLGSLNPSGFETNIVDGGKVFFLGAEVELEGVDFDLLLKKAQECYESCP
ncbi:hypothetical protein CNMCM8980_000135 [Aspergillus fumigatiaffinis]|uniref:Uncharacterized protein n=1 Tax=Aspergillus fumigatiaffinis TaxID=340414 RepID=A0A8H4GTA0_9EURO|nr:hypothetical protein CNMCM6805_002593 [Aspergillus fumigatiaffinis]KAF4243228.1 hypothetical protein CNMCM8980_000135 [Aspergillus fumigatiaffinis]